MRRLPQQIRNLLWPAWRRLGDRRRPRLSRELAKNSSAAAETALLPKTATSLRSSFCRRIALLRWLRSQRLLQASCYWDRSSVTIYGSPQRDTAAKRRRNHSCEIAGPRPIVASIRYRKRSRKFSHAFSLQVMKLYCRVSKCTSAS